MRALALAIGVLVAVAVVRAGSWARVTATTVSAITGAGAGAASAVDINNLPAPVRAYFRKVLPPDFRRIRSAVATQQAEFFVNSAWRPLTATQHFRAFPPAFVWDARIQMAPLMPALVRDSYVDGRGGMQASLFGVYTLVDQADTPELNAGALQRFLGEAVWIPTALLPSESVSWTPRDDRSAVVTINDRGHSVALVFEFDDTALVHRISGQRYQEQQGRYALKPWIIDCGEAHAQAGFLIPMRCVVAWNNDGRIEPYWRGRIRTIDYRFD